MGRHWRDAATTQLTISRVDFPAARKTFQLPRQKVIPEIRASNGGGETPRHKYA
jgi:hypothetical protein